MRLNWKIRIMEVWHELKGASHCLSQTSLLAPADFSSSIDKLVHSEKYGSPDVSKRKMGKLVKNGNV